MSLFLILLYFCISYCGVLLESLVYLGHKEFLIAENTDERGKCVVRSGINRDLSRGYDVSLFALDRVEQ